MKCNVIFQSKKTYTRTLDHLRLQLSSGQSTQASLMLVKRNIDLALTRLVDTRGPKVILMSSLQGYVSRG